MSAEIKVLLEKLAKYYEGVPFHKLRQDLNVHSKKLTQLLDKVVSRGVVKQGNDKLYFVTDLGLKVMKDEVNFDDLAKVKDRWQKPDTPSSLEEIIKQFDSETPYVKVDMDANFSDVLKCIYNQFSDAERPLFVNTNYICGKLNIQQDSLSGILDFLASKNLVTLKSDKMQTYLTLAGLRQFEDWPTAKIAHATLAAIRSLNNRKEKSAPKEIGERSSLRNFDMFSYLLDYFVKEELLAYESHGRNGPGSTELKSYTILPRGIKLMDMLDVKLAYAKKQPAPVQIETPQLVKEEPVPIPAQETAVQAEEYVTSWGAKPEEIVLFGQQYTLIVVGERGRLGQRIDEAKGKGFIPMTNSQRHWLTEIVKYSRDDGTFDLDSAMRVTNLPKARLANLLEQYKSLGIVFSKPDEKPISKEPVPETPDTNYQGILEKFEQGYQQSYAALKELTDIVKRHEQEIKSLKEQKKD
jgi:predicted transcriptional regulator